MPEKVLSVFIDESGDFGPYEAHSPYYIVSMVLHDQASDITGDIARFNEHLQNLGYPQHAVHTGPLIRREAIYANDLTEDRKRLFNALFHFTRRLDIRYACIKVKKRDCPDVISMTAQLSKKIAETLRQHETYWNSFDRVIVYYDNGQIELTKIITSVFNTLYTHVEFRKVRPVDYKLFQSADLICTMELLAEKADSASFTKSEQEFFGSVRAFRKDYLRTLEKKKV